MCESNVYLSKDGSEQLVLENVDFLENENGRIRMINLFGEEKTIRAKVKTLSLVDHKIILEPV
ncbi:MAG: CooT family nickel-binding protein [Desulfatiglandaceae bacterium]